MSTICVSNLFNESLKNVTSFVTRILKHPKFCLIPDGKFSNRCNSYDNLFFVLVEEEFPDMQYTPTLHIIASYGGITG